MPEEVFSQHHLLLNLRDQPHRVENWRDGVHRDFLFAPGEIVVTPAGVRSGWRWHSRSRVIVVTLEPDRLRRFAEHEVGVLLTETQLQNRPQFSDPDLCEAGALLRDALEGDDPGSSVVYESLARIFLVKLIRRYSDRLDEVTEHASRFASKEYRRVLAFIERNYGSDIGVEDLAREAGLSSSHFSRLFKRSLGQSPHQFLMKYRVERAAEMLVRRPDRPLAQVALDAGFSDQAHFSRTFKRFAGATPTRYRAART
ncbi:MAG: AraC family transcriptional regulator [Acidobacteriota bacterium]